MVQRTSQYPNLRLLGVCTRWERTFFYFPEVPSSSGGPLLPAFDPGLPTSRECWKVRNYGDPGAIAVLTNRLGELVAEGLTGLDLMITWQSRRMQPLQSRVHGIGEWSPRGDSTWISNLPLAQYELAGWIQSMSFWMVDDPP